LFSIYIVGIGQQEREARSFPAAEQGCQMFVL
jgi:hypothetical protein